MGKAVKIYKKLHKWPGFIISFILLYYSITGIFMNHRELFSHLDVSRKYLPSEFHYKNWNNAALKGNLTINNDSILVYGNIGIWVTDSTFTNYSSLNKGFPKGSDHKKIFDLHHTKSGDLYAATLFGLYAFDQHNNKWKKFNLNVKLTRFVGITEKNDTIYVVNRSFLFKGKSNGINTRFEKIQLKPSEDSSHKVSLFETIWQIHSGEILGLPGKLYVDILGIITAFLSITGIIYFLFPGWIKRRKHKQKTVKKIASINRWSLKWHNKLGTWLFISFIILFFTGMFLRPPLLISIAGVDVNPVKFTHLDQPNPWYDKLRFILYNKQRDIFLLSTSEGMYYFKDKSDVPKKFEVQPPISVMGINVLEPYGKGAYLVGSFNGLFLWHPGNPQILNFVTGKPYQGNRGGRPIGDFKTTGLITDIEGKQFLIDYDRGILPLWHNKRYPDMPETMLNQFGMSLWNFSLEVHTGRIFQGILGDFYILLVPLGGLISVMVVLSGYLLWRKKFKRKNNNKTKNKYYERINQ